MINSEENNSIVNRRRSTTLILMTSNPIQIFQFPSETTHYEEQDIQDKYIILYVYGNIQRAYRPDQYYPHSSMQKLDLLFFTSIKNMTKKILMHFLYSPQII